MLDTVKEKIKANAQNKVYDKENKETIVKFRDTVIEDIHSTLADAQAVKQAAEKLMENGGTHTSKNIKLSSLSLCMYSFMFLRLLFVFCNLLYALYMSINLNFLGDFLSICSSESIQDVIYSNSSARQTEE